METQRRCSDKEDEFGALEDRGRLGSCRQRSGDASRPVAGPVTSNQSVNNMEVGPPILVQCAYGSRSFHSCWHPPTPPPPRRLHS